MTNAELFESVLRKIGVLSESESASAEQSDDMLEVLNDLRGSLAADGIDLGIAPQTSATATLLLNEGVREDLKWLLCTRAAVEFEVPVTPAIEFFSGQAYARLLRNAVVAEMEPASLTHTPYRHFGSFDIERG